MSDIFDEIDESVDKEELEKQIEKGRETAVDVPKGEYDVKFTTLEIGTTKDGKRPMFKVVAEILEGKQKKRKLFMNRVIYGTKNDGSMIASVEGFLKKLEAEDEDGELYDTKFKTYKKFSQLVMDIAEAVDDMGLQYRISYDSTAFNDISIVKVIDD